MVPGNSFYKNIVVDIHSIYNLVHMTAIRLYKGGISETVEPTIYAHIWGFSLVWKAVKQFIKSYIFFFCLEWFELAA